ncbi:MAG: hypothetical protein CMI09_11770 [Oceanospirillaceae bacterium]|nr:hypothetical protein [Oceanospirillaceae bacterium]|tara:strand:- start:520 stop:828 length:309 start_codon:yes stop_codon:yes gene_type:complete
MSIDITIKCDGYSLSCYEELWVTDLDQLKSTLDGWGWKVSVLEYGDHYCPECLAKIEKDQAKEEEIPMAANDTDPFACGSVFSPDTEEEKSSEENSSNGSQL